MLLQLFRILIRVVGLTTFNSGVMVIDAKKWRENRLTQSLLELTAKHHEHVYGDQGILNMYFGDQLAAFG